MEKTDQSVTKFKVPLGVVLLITVLVAGGLWGYIIFGLRKIEAEKPVTEKKSQTTPTPTATLTPTPDTQLEQAKQELQKQIIEKYFPQCNDNRYALQKNNSYQMYELKRAGIFLDILKKTTAADKENGKIVYGGNIKFVEIQGQEKPVYRVSNQEYSLENLSFKENSYEQGTPFYGYVNVESINGTWKIVREGFVPLSCSVVIKTLGAEERNKQLKILNKQLLESFNKTAISTVGSLLTKCDGNYFVKELWEDDSDKTKGYILHQFQSFEIVPSKDENLSEVDSADVEIRVWGQVKHQPVGDGLQGRTSNSAVIIVLKKQGVGWVFSDPFIKKVTCSDVAKIQSELY